MERLAITCPEGANTDRGANRDGAYRIEWTGPSGVDLTLIETGPLGPKPLYSGPERASTVTGRLKGEYRYHVASADATMTSAPCTVKVAPYPLSLALGFFGLGLLVTVSTVWVIIRGHLAHRRGAL